MPVEKLIFYAFAALMLFAAVRVISVRNSVQAVLFLVLTFFCAAVLWMLAEAEFLAITLVLVYVGAVMVLFLFVVMMLDVDYAAMREGFARLLPFGIIVSLMFFGVLFYILRDRFFGPENLPPPPPHGADYSNVEALGEVLYTEYFYPFEIAAVLLLVAMVAAISLTFRGRQQRKGQQVSRQLQAQKSDRLKIVTMASESPRKATPEPAPTDPEEGQS